MSASVENNLGGFFFFCLPPSSIGERALQCVSAGGFHHEVAERFGGTGERGTLVDGVHVVSRLRLPAFGPSPGGIHYAVRKTISSMSSPTRSAESVLFSWLHDERCNRLRVRDLSFPRLLRSGNSRDIWPTTPTGSCLGGVGAISGRGDGKFFSLDACRPTAYIDSTRW